jgi:enolase-phosphatase E1
MKVILCDIEGTTTDISFVKDVLFPYALNECKDFLNQRFEDPDIKEIVRDLCSLSADDGNAIQESDDRRTFINSVTDYVHTLIKQDRKVKELKTLQGKIWKIGFENGSLKGKYENLKSIGSKILSCFIFVGHVYPDVQKNFQKWISQDCKIYIYSSGSVEAQKLLFANSEHGNLLKLISGHFDTNVGHKQESQSYENILKEINVEGASVLFLSDIPKEVIAAEEAGMKVVILDRPNNPTDLDDDIRKRFKVVQTFDEIEF